MPLILYNAGNLLKFKKYSFDLAYSSMLIRAVRTLWIVLDTIGSIYIPIYKTWHLNERHYGVLQGSNKKEIENIFGKGLVDPAIFFIGLQPHTLLEKYALEHKILKPNYNPMSMMPWTARKLLWNPGSLGEKLGQVCLEAFDNPEDEFGKTVIDILEREYGTVS